MIKKNGLTDEMACTLKNKTINSTSERKKKNQGQLFKRTLKHNNLPKKKKRKMKFLGYLIKQTN